MERLDAGFLQSAIMRLLMTSTAYRIEPHLPARRRRFPGGIPEVALIRVRVMAAIYLQLIPENAAGPRYVRRHIGGSHART